MAESLAGGPPGAGTGGRPEAAMTAKARSTPRAHHPRPPSRMRLFVSGGTECSAVPWARSRPRPATRWETEPLEVEDAIGRYLT